MNAKLFLKKHKLEICIFVLAVVVRLVFFGLSYTANNGNLTGVINGGDDYYELSQGIVAGHGYTIATAPPYTPSSFRTPGMPYFIALLYMLFGSYFVVIFAHILIGSIIPVLGMRLARYLTDFRGVAFATGLFLALEPTLALLSTELLSDTLFTALLCLSFLHLFRYWKERNLKALVLSSFLMGLATLVRPPVEYLPILIGFLLVWEGGRRLSRDVLIRVGIYMLVFLSTLSPWLYRNYTTFGVVGLSSQQGAALYGVVVPSVLAIEHDSNFAKEQPAGTEALGATTFQESKEYTKKAIPILLNAPESLSLFGVDMVFSFLTFDGTYDVLSRLKVSADLYTTLTQAKVASGIAVGAPTLLIFTSSPLSALRFLFALAKTPVVLLLIGRGLWVLITLGLFVGAGYYLQRKRRTIYVAAATSAIVYFTLVTIAVGFNISARYRMPVDPFIVTFALGGAVLVGEWFWKKYMAYKTK
jgi:4-amino-4-deoxy-L-arabinose transferase-like glycosyltransferase